MIMFILAYLVIFMLVFKYNKRKLIASRTISSIFCASSGLVHFKDFKKFDNYVCTKNLCQVMLISNIISYALVFIFDFELPKFFSILMLILGMVFPALIFTFKKHFTEGVSKVIFLNPVANLRVIIYSSISTLLSAIYLT